MKSFDQFIEKLKRVSLITLCKDNIKRSIEYTENYGCTINSITTNGNCSFVYNEYLYLLSLGFKES